MEVVRCWEEEGVIIPEPFHRKLKVILAPDKRDVHEASFNQAIIFPEGKTDYHSHDRPELIYVVHGRGVSVCSDVRSPIETDMVLWVRAGEMHQIINTGDDEMKLATVFVPPITAEVLCSTCLDSAAGQIDDGKSAP